MGVTTKDMFGSDGAQLAVPGSYGVAPRGFRLPDATRLGEVRLQVADLERSLTFYRDVMGLRVLRSDTASAVLGAQGDDTPLVALQEQPGARNAAGGGRLGLYHFAILLPDRPALGRFLRHLTEMGVRAGASDHLVSEALYLQDPDGLGIEVYRDRPRTEWKRLGRELMMATDPLDARGVLSAAGDVRWSGLPDGTTIGHVHLHVGSIEESGAFFGDALGFDRMVDRYPGALFLGAGGYHHHLGTNIWAGPAAVPPGDADARLLEWTIELPGDEHVAALTRSLLAGGFANSADGGDVVTRDSWGTAIRIRAQRNALAP